MVCSKCNTRFTTYEPFCDLSLPLVKEGKGLSSLWGSKYPTTIQDCLRAFSGDELLEGKEAF